MPLELHHIYTNSLAFVASFLFSKTAKIRMFCNILRKLFKNNDGSATLIENGADGDHFQEQENSLCR